MTAADTNPADLFRPRANGAGPAQQPSRLCTLECPVCHGSGRVVCQTMGERLRALRQAAGLTADQLAEMTGGAISGSNVSQIEVGGNLNPRVGALQALARALGVKVGFLIDGEEA